MKNPFNSQMRTGLLFSIGDTWKKHRKLTSKVFHFDFLKARVPEVCATTDAVFEKMEKQEGFKKINLYNYLLNITGNVVGNLFFGTDFEKIEIMG